MVPALIVTLATTVIALMGSKEAYVNLKSMSVVQIHAIMVVHVYSLIRICLCACVQLISRVLNVSRQLIRALVIPVRMQGHVWRVRMLIRMYVYARVVRPENIARIL